MTVVVRMAPSPTGFLHVGGVRTFLFNWLFARHEGGENLLRIENTDTTREVAEAVDQIQDSLRWLGIDWDGPHTFQLDRMDDCRRVAEQLVAEGKAYEDDGAIRFRMPDDGVDRVGRRRPRPHRVSRTRSSRTSCIVRSDGRPTYNFASPLEDVWDGITHVIRGDDHISNTPKQMNIIRAVGGDVPGLRARPEHLRRRRQEALEAARRAPGSTSSAAAGYLPEALMNFLALLGWAPDGETTVMSAGRADRALLARARQRRARPSSTTQKLDWLNGVYLRELAAAGVRAPARHLARRERLRLGRRARRARGAARTGEDRAAGGVPRLRGFPLRRRASPTRPTSTAAAPMLAATEDALVSLEPFEAAAIETALRAAADGLGLKPRQAFQPVRVAVTGLEGLSGPVREHRAARTRGDAQPSPGGGGRGGVGSGLGGASGSRARWNTSQRAASEALGRDGRQAGRRSGRRIRQSG